MATLHGPRATAEQLGDLVQAARAGDRAAFERLVVATSPQVYALAYRLVGNEDDARDVLQDTYLRAFRSIGRFRGDAAFATWLHRIAANCSTTLLARRHRRRSTELDEQIEVVECCAEHDPESVLGAVDDRRRLVEALAALPYDLRAVVVLHDVYDLPREAIAAELKISRAAAKVRSHRARRRLRDALFPPADGRGAPESESAGVVVAVASPSRARTAHPARARHADAS